MPALSNTSTPATISRLHISGRTSFTGKGNLKTLTVTYRYGGGARKGGTTDEEVILG